MGHRIERKERKYARETLLEVPKMLKVWTPDRIYVELCCIDCRSSIVIDTAESPIDPLRRPEPERGATMRTIVLGFLFLILGGCASFPMPDTARGPNGERLPDLCYEWTFYGMTKALMCHPAPKAN